MRAVCRLVRIDTSYVTTVSLAFAAGHPEITEERAIERYRAARDERVLDCFEQCTSLGHDLSRLAG